ncbi:hypothetical protein [Geothrix sp. PMB-07]|uniref:hypothetical protein n=1 Tax=Geothrix sp. PMB-07 TaxID=3068640 RepID=UPI002740BEAF|nr:hypothetical protein [Geothrix sp. PMB-07]WLT33156.1 hypothetical protein Q9293_07445 [Geothrix sp. PMB-07]
MRCLVLAPWLVLLLFGAGCRKPEPVARPQAQLIVRFLDRDAVLDLAAVPPAGPWRVMNAGLWEPLEIRWKPGPVPIGAAVVGRTAPDWVLLEDPAQDTHRVVMRGPGPEELARRNERMDPDERDALALLGVLWALSWARH